MDEYSNIIYYGRKGFGFFNKGSQYRESESREDFDLVYCLATIAGIAPTRPQPVVGELLYRIGHVYPERAEEFYTLSYRYGYKQAMYSLAALHLHNSDYEKCIATLQLITGLSPGTCTYEDWDMSKMLIGKINRARFLRALASL